MKDHLRRDIETLRKKVLDMIEENENLPAIEKLLRYDFNLDMEERAKLLTQREERLKEVKMI